MVPAEKPHQQNIPWIQRNEFERAIKRLFKAPGIRPTARIGLAVSGGVDSMVLAYMWTRQNEDSPRTRHEYRPIIIDHRLSPQNTEVGERTKRRLIDLIQRRRGASDPIIAHLTWPGGHGHPGKRPDFETTARRLRYQKLARECLADEIDTLFVGHHADDVAETVLARLANGHEGSGLASIEPYKQIPECQGMFGIYQSGSFVRDDTENPSPHYVGGPEDGGLTIQRPLLDFPKARLVATSKQKRIKYDEDETNADPTLTERNAIRKLLSDDVLPKALRRQSLVKLAQTVLEARIEKDRIAQNLYEASEVHFDLRSACLQVRPPDTNDVFGDDWQHWNEPQRSDIAGRFIRSLASAVIEQHGKPSSIQPGQYYNLFRSFLSSSYTDKTTSTINISHRSSDKRTKTQDRVEAGGALFSKRPIRNSEPTDNIEWVISRRPYSLRDIPPPITYPPNPPLTIARHHGPLKTEPSKVQAARKFRYWDNRFWIRINNESAQKVYLVTLSQTLYERFTRSLGGKQREKLMDTLKEVAPGHIRFTLPAIVIFEDNVELAIKRDHSAFQKAWKDMSERKKILNYVDQSARVIAVPTIGYIADGWEDKLSWDIRHKKLGLSGLKKMERPGEDPHPFILSKGPAGEI